jgi:hypothetical protein
MNVCSNAVAHIIQGRVVHIKRQFEVYSANRRALMELVFDQRCNSHHMI